MKNAKTTLTAIGLVIVIISGSALQARVPINTAPDRPELNQLTFADPAFCVAEHNVGKMVLSVTNYGCMGHGFIYGPTVDCFTGAPVRSCEFPNGSGDRYMFGGAMWVGAVVGRDTLVSVAQDGWIYNREFNPDGPPNGDMIYRSTLDPSQPEYVGAVSEQDYIGVFTDTFTSGVPGLTNDEVDGRPHIPLHIEVTQKSYAWSYPFTEDFVLLDYEVKNIGEAELEQVYIGFLVDGDVHLEGQQGYTDDITGFMQTVEVDYGGCPYETDVNTAWIADEDGDYAAGSFRVPNVTGMRIIRTPSDSLRVSYNWWVSNGNPSLDFGPQHQDQLRPMVGGISTGTPAGDRNKYFVMRNGEFDYDQIYTRRIGPSDPVWVYPNQATAPDISNGFDTRYLLSFGPFDIAPGQTLPVTLAYVGGQYLHTDPYNAMTNLFGSYNPEIYYDNLNFADLSFNSLWADWIYDNPGYDTDQDGYAGQFVVCNTDTIWVKGDGVPDFRAASPPPPPTKWVDSRFEELRLRFNGLHSETSADVFSGKVDFEGYNVYIAQTNQHESYAQMASWDIENYTKYIWIPYRGEWEVRDYPFTLEELRCLYAASCDDASFDPLDYTVDAPFIHPVFYDSVFYFEPFGHNHSMFTSNGIHKLYPDQPYPSSLNPALAHPDELTPDGYLKYFEYEMTIDGLLANQCYFVNVTTTDHGAVIAGLPPMESRRTLGSVYACTEGPVQVSLDIMPGECPNELDVMLFREMPDDPEEDPTRANRIVNDDPMVIEVAIMGGPDLNVGDIVPQTLALNGWAAIDWVWEDVGTAMPLDVPVCDCNTDGPDGYTDLVFTVRKPLFLLVSHDVDFGSDFSLELSGLMDDGRPVVGSDCVLLSRHQSTPATGTATLLGNFPNPFNPSTEISFSLPNASQVRLEIYNIAGQVVATLADGQYEAGNHAVVWDGKGFASGVYFYRLDADGVISSRKMLLIK